MPLTPVVVVADYRIGDPMHRRLRGYKDATTAEARHTHCTALARMVGSWMAANRDGLWRRFGTWEVVVSVPSTHRPLGTPVDVLISQLPELARCHRRVLERGSEPTGHLRAARGGFAVSSAVDRGWLRCRRILVFDDTITTGARAQSAVAALRLARARVVGVVVVGRAVGGAPEADAPSSPAA